MISINDIAIITNSDFWIGFDKGGVIVRLSTPALLLCLLLLAAAFYMLHWARSRRHHVPATQVVPSAVSPLCPPQDAVSVPQAIPYSLSHLQDTSSDVYDEEPSPASSIPAKSLDMEPSEVTVSSLDEELISHVIADIEANMRTANYSVVQLSSAVGMTRGHLYKKLMAITGKSPVEFIRMIKMKRGKSLLDQGKTNISEVADMVGYSGKLFAQYFKAMYGETPSGYLKNKK